MKIRLYTAFNPCNFACEYCITMDRIEDRPEEEKAQKSLPILSRIARNLAQPKKTAARIAAVAKSPSMLFSRQEPATWSEDKFERIVDRIGELPYKVDLRIGVGGEFFLSKTLANGARKITNYDNVVALNLISNLSFRYKQYQKILDGFDLSKVALVCSYHPTQVKDRAVWRETAVRMSKLVDLAVIVVAWPPVLDRIEDFKKEFADAGLTVFVQAFNGWVNGKKYPDSYSEEERALLRSLAYSRHDYAHMVELKTPGLCYAGMDYVLMNINGEVFRCGGFHVPYGNIFDGFKLLEKPTECPVTECWCDTDNLNTVAFRENYEMIGRNQHKYQYRFAEEAKLDPSLDEWSIDY
ncbi:MAG: hypothetical protein AAF560_21685 [Acidobacteriota bacterium]